MTDTPALPPPPAVPPPPTPEASYGTILQPIGLGITDKTAIEDHLNLGTGYWVEINWYRLNDAGEKTLVHTLPLHQENFPATRQWYRCGQCGSRYPALKSGGVNYALGAGMVRRTKKSVECNTRQCSRNVKFQGVRHVVYVYYWMTKDGEKVIMF